MIPGFRTAFVGRFAQTLHVQTRHLVGPKPFACNHLSISVGRHDGGSCRSEVMKKNRKLTNDNGKTTMNVMNE